MVRSRHHWENIPCWKRQTCSKGRVLPAGERTPSTPCGTDPEGEGPALFTWTPVKAFLFPVLLMTGLASTNDGGGRTNVPFSWALARIYSKAHIFFLIYQAHWLNIAQVIPNKKNNDRNKMPPKKPSRLFSPGSWQRITLHNTVFRTSSCRTTRVVSNGFSTISPRTVPQNPILAVRTFFTDILSESFLLSHFSIPSHLCVCVAPVLAVRVNNQALLQLLSPSSFLSILFLFVLSSVFKAGDFISLLSLTQADQFLRFAYFSNT